MRRIAKYMLTLSLLLAGRPVFACDCRSQGEFLTVAPKSEFVALVRVTRYLSFKSIYNQQTPMSMEVEVVDVYKGAETRKKLIIWGDIGNLCRPYLSQFDTSKHYVIAFYKASDGSKGHVHKDERPTDYAISSCGDYWLKADIGKQKAVGVVAKKLNEIRLSELKAKLSSR